MHLKQMVNYVKEAVVEKRQFPEGHRHGENGDNGGNGGGDGTAVSIVYMTASKTFDGPVMGYTTIGVPGGNNGGSQDSVTAHVPVPTGGDSSATLDSTRPTAAGHSSHSAASAAAASSSLSDSIAATSGISQTPTDSFAAATSSSAAVTSSTSSSDAGLSGGAKAGIAIGVLLAVALIGGLAFFAFRRRKLADEANEKAENEKANPFGDSAAAPAPAPAPLPAPPPAPAAAPRPQVQSTDFFNGPAMSGALGAAAGAGAAGAAANARSAPVEHLEKPVNPFAETPNNTSQASLTQSIPIGTDEHMIPPSTSDSERAAFGATVAGAALATRPNAPPSLDHGPAKPLPPFAAGAAPASPAASTFSVNSATAGAAAAATNRELAVHRVQLDFKGSMHDELDVRTGELVAIMHEYDDGWVLARRMDKSKQGVCPRSCLSQRPLQPRNRGPPPPGARGPPPPRTASPAPSQRGPPGPGRSQSPAPGGPPPMRTASPAPGSRSASPALNPNMNNWPAKPINASTITPNMNQWPMKPTNAPSSGGEMAKRSMSPGPYGGGPPQAQRPYGPVKRRSNSMGNITPARPTVPNFPGADRMSDRSTTDDLGLPIQSPNSPVSRKPVPGQAS